MKDYAAFRAEYVRLSALSEYERCNALAESEKRRRAKQEAQHVWRDEYALEWETSYTHRPVEDTLFARLEQTARRRLGKSIAVDPLAEFGAELIREVFQELRRDARHDALLRDILKARGVTLAHIELERGKVRAVEVALP